MPVIHKFEFRLIKKWTPRGQHNKNICKSQPARLKS